MLGRIAAAALLAGACGSAGGARAAEAILPAGTYQISVTEFLNPSGLAAPVCPLSWAGTFETAQAGVLQYAGAGNGGSYISMPWTYLEPKSVVVGSVNSLGGRETKIALPPVPAAGPQNWHGQYTLSQHSIASWTGTNTPTVTSSTSHGTISLHMHVIDARSFIAYGTEDVLPLPTPCYSVIAGTLLH